MKKTFILFALLFSTYFSFSQSFALFDSEGSIANGGTIEVTGTADASIIYSYINLVNLSSSTASVRVIRHTISTVPGTTNSFCWGQCYEPDVDTSLRTLQILANDTSFDFAGEYKPLLHRGTSTLRYVFYNTNDLNDTITVTVNFTATSIPAGISNSASGISDISNAYPNPAHDNTTIKYSLPKNIIDARLIIRDCLGALVINQPLTGSLGKTNVDLSNLNVGIYFYSIIADNTALCTRKLVIK